MSNPLFGMFGGGNQMMQHPLLQKFQQFRQSFQGDAGQQIQQLLNSGKVNQQQYNQAMQMAQQFRRFIGGK